MSKFSNSGGVAMDKVLSVVPPKYTLAKTLNSLRTDPNVENPFVTAHNPPAAPAQNDTSSTHSGQ